VEYLNLGGGMNLTSGVFTVPKSGTYAFTFKGSSYASNDGVELIAGYGEVSIQRNRVALAKGYSVVFGATSGRYMVNYLRSSHFETERRRYNCHLPRRRRDLF